jgi:hypothetical protein
MSRESREAEDAGQDNSPAQGPNLTLLYSLLGTALLAAIAIAALIILPFYRHRH